MPRIITNVFWIFLLLGADAWAQNPFGPAGGAEAENPFGGAAPPAAPAQPAAPATQPKDGQSPAEPADELKPRSSVVEAIFESNPTTPRQLVEAARHLDIFGEPALGRQMLDKFLAAKLGDDALAALPRELGSGFFIDLGSRKNLAPQAVEVTKQVMDAIGRKVRDPARLSALVKQLEDPSARRRAEAAYDLGEAHLDAVPPLVAALADPSRDRFDGNYRDALVDLGNPTAWPLLAVLQSPDPKLRRQVVETLGRLDHRHATLWLMGTLASRSEDTKVRAAAYRALQQVLGVRPTREVVLEQLEKHVRLFLTDSTRLPATHDDRVRTWQWDDPQRKLTSRMVPHADATAELAAQLARYLYEAEPSRLDYRRLYLIGQLKAASLRAGRDNPLPAGQGTIHDLAASLGADVVEDALREALRTDQPIAATGAAQVLGEIGTPELLYRAAPKVSPLALAMQQDDPRLRFAAAEAILRLAPERPYAGSSHLPKVLGYFAASANRPKAIVGHPDTDRAQRLAGALRASGFETDVANTGADLIRLARQSPDVELVLVSHVIDSPPIDPLIQELRRDQHSSRLPIGILGTDETIEQARKLARGDALLEAFPWPQTAEGAKFYADRLLATTTRDRIGRESRGKMAQRALGALAMLADTTGQRAAMYDLIGQEQAVLRALNTPSLSVVAANTAGKLGTPAAQRGLVDLASQELFAIDARRAAAGAFRQSVARHGILLTKDEILRQYDRYNASATADKDTQAVLAAILDAIEEKGTRG